MTQTSHFTLQPLLPIWLLVVIFLPLTLLSLIFMFKKNTSFGAWLRRLLMVAVLLIIALRPITYEDSVENNRLNANIIFVVDRTGSMNAEDFLDGQTRLSAVKSDMRNILQMVQGARFGIVAFDSMAASELPLTTDTTAVESWIDTLKTEYTSHSAGSNLNRVLRPLEEYLEKVKNRDPDGHYFVYLFSDGENTDDEYTLSFEFFREKIAGGAILGYGTQAGGPMKAQGGEHAGEYIQDPSGGNGLSKINEENLKQIAEEMELTYIHRTTPEVDFRPTLNNVQFEVIEDTLSDGSPTIEDWYWIPAILLSFLASWELAAQTLKLGRRPNIGEIAQLGQKL